MLLSLASAPLPTSASMILAILHLFASQDRSTGYRGVMSRSSCQIVIVKLKAKISSPYLNF